MFNMFIILGLLLLVLAIVFALPFLGVGMFIPVLGDVIDIPLSMIMAVAGIIFLIIGGMISLVANYWWVLALVIAVIVLLDIFKIRIRVIR
jgi:hypothetical protein